MRPSSSEAAEPAAPATADVHSLLVEARARVEEILARLPCRLVEARAVIERDLWRAPRPEEVQILVKIASDGTSVGARRQLPREALALRLVARRVLAEFWREATVDPTELRHRAQAVRELLAVLLELQRTVMFLHPASAGMGQADRGFVRTCLSAMLPGEEEMVAAVLLAPRLARLLECAAAGGAPPPAPSLTQEESAVIASIAAAPDHPAERWRRVCLEVAAVRWQIAEDLRAWEALPPGESAEDEVTRARLLRQLQEDQGAYRVVSERLQIHQDATLRTRDRAGAEWLGRFRKPLFTSQKLLLQAMQNRVSGEPAASGPPSAGTRLRFVAGAGEDGSADPTVLGELDQVIEAASARIPANTKSGAIELTTSSGKATARDRLVALCAALAATCVLAAAVYMKLPVPPRPRIEVSASEFAREINLTEAEPIGTLLYASVPGSWSSYSERERLRQVNALARVARKRGFNAILLVDHSGEPVACWDSDRGSVLQPRAGAPAVAVVRPPRAPR